MMRVLLISFFVLLLAAPCVAQDDDVVRVKSNLVNIDLIVKDKKGKYVSDLKAEDFAVVENGVAQKIEFFDAPLSRTDPKAAAGAGATTTPPNAAPRHYV